MTHLQRKALATVPLDEKTVEVYHDESYNGSRLRDLCASHERLRAKLRAVDTVLRHCSTHGETLTVQAVWNSETGKANMWIAYAGNLNTIDARASTPMGALLALANKIRAEEDTP